MAIHMYTHMLLHTLNPSHTQARAHPTHTNAHAAPHAHTHTHTTSWP